MTILFFWTGVTPTMAACWRVLADQPATRVVVFLELPANPATDFDHEAMLAGVEHRIFRQGAPLDRPLIEREIAALDPDAMIVLGWRSRLCRLAAESHTLHRVTKLFAFDMPFVWSFRKFVAPIALRSYLKRFSTAIVPGERAAAYARYLGFPAGRIERGLIGVDAAAAAEAAAARRALSGYPRRFLYVGRYAPEKRLDVLVGAYRRYRAGVRRPWELTCCGMGPEAGQLRGVEGIVDRGFVQPADMGGVFASHGAFVIASDYDPWPFVILEAVAAGLPVICTSACGNSVELVRSYFNGRVVGAGDEAALAEALVWLHEHESEARQIGERGIPLAAPYAKEVWAERMLAICRRVMSGQR